MRDKRALRQSKQHCLLCTLTPGTPTPRTPRTTPQPPGNPWARTLSNTFIKDLPRGQNQPAFLPCSTTKSSSEKKRPSKDVLWEQPLSQASESFPESRLQWTRAQCCCSYSSIANALALPCSPGNLVTIDCVSRWGLICRAVFYLLLSCW